jgi:predicted DNA-binding protein (UPF0251 family)
MRQKLKRKEIKMPRPFKCRRVRCRIKENFFKPCGIPFENLEEIQLTIDELEAIRLADLQELYQEEAAEKMGISRQTFGNIIKSAHKKIADFLINAKLLKIEGGAINIKTRKFVCFDCKNVWEVPFGVLRHKVCPKCQSSNIHRAEEEKGYARNFTDFTGIEKKHKHCRRWTR